jgi:prepilin-type N-terminal cleavage/methylation domain-containing protein
MLVRKPYGYSLVETMIVLALMGIIAAMAIPSMIETYRKQQLKNLLQTVAGTLDYARATAFGAPAGGDPLGALVVITVLPGYPETWAFCIKDATPAAMPPLPPCTLALGPILRGREIANGYALKGWGYTLEPLRGIITGAGIFEFSNGQYSASIRISKLGRPIICSDSQLGGIQPCTVTQP